MYLSQIWVYPVKSLRGYPVTQAELTARGLQHDRRWMIVNAEGQFLTQRQIPGMVLIRAYGAKDHLQLQIPHLGEVQIGIPKEADADPLTVTVWRSQCRALRPRHPIHNMLSEQLGQPCSLVYMPDTTQRAINPGYALSPNDAVSFADGYPYLLATEASLTALNAQLAEPVTMERFRPNLVITGSTSFAEDHWRNLRIGDFTFTAVKPCERCVMVTIDPDQGLTAKEPLQTLARLHRVNQKVIFGQNLIGHHNTGQLQVGDPVVIL
jgi:uncharacterized protein YcbX